jgi:DNA-directed RNA polymerase subunit K
MTLLPRAARTARPLPFNTGTDCLGRMLSMAMAKGNKVTRFERARIIGARALQIGSGAPILIPVTAQEAIDPVGVAEREYDEGVIPITVLREAQTTRKE